MRLKDKKDILNMTFDNMKMREKRSEEIIKELINYNTEAEHREAEEAMKENKIEVGKNLHEISPKNNKRSRWQYVLGSLCALAVAALGITIWYNANIDGRYNNTDSAVQSDKEDTVYYSEKGDDKILSAAVIHGGSSDDMLYRVKHGNISMVLKPGYNYNLYSKQTEDGLELLAVGIRKEGNTFYYIYSRQLEGASDIVSETSRILDEIDDTAYLTPEFIEVNFTEGEKYEGERDAKVFELSIFCDYINDFIGDSKPLVSYTQQGIQGELPEGEFEYELLVNAEKEYVTCGVKDPTYMRLEGYFSYLNEEIGQ